MKLIAAAVLSLAAVSANAETITLYNDAGEGNTKQFSDIPNSAGIDVDLILSSSYPSVYLNLGGVPCHSPTGNDPVQITNVTLTCDNGSWAILTATFSKVTRTINMGRLHQTVTRWTLEGGTVQRP